MKTWFASLGAFAGVLALGLTAALAQQGPVATACGDDIAKLCADKEHGQGALRMCLEENRDKLSEACRAALDSTGPGKGMGQNRPNN
ncbi:MAG TPA: cysteine rich repeat-containing protein [Hyphomicrobiales bacterium]|nr:cysteine rich repeat-containing protein [Hyphomicrobiales bacterium]